MGFLVPFGCLVGAAAALRDSVVLVEAAASGEVVLGSEPLTVFGGVADVELATLGDERLLGPTGVAAVAVVAGGGGLTGAGAAEAGGGGGLTGAGAAGTCFKGGLLTDWATDTGGVEGLAATGEEGGGVGLLGTLVRVTGTSEAIEGAFDTGLGSASCVKGCFCSIGCVTGLSGTGVGTDGGASVTTATAASGLVLTTSVFNSDSVDFTGSLTAGSPKLTSLECKGVLDTGSPTAISVFATVTSPDAEPTDSCTSMVSSAEGATLGAAPDFSVEVDVVWEADA